MLRDGEQGYSWRQACRREWTRTRKDSELDDKERYGDNIKNHKREQNRPFLVIEREGS